MATPEENESFGRFLIEVLAEFCCCKPTPDAINRAVYKMTDCGAWCLFDASGIKVGTIVEGSEAGFSTRVDVTGLDCDEESARELIDRFTTAIDECEDFADGVIGVISEGT
jgi:hypothetical protein